MSSRFPLRLSQCALIASILMPGAAYAACTMPNTLTNGQATDASKVMGNFSALSTCLDNNGSVSTGTAGQVGVYDTSGNNISGKSLSDIIDNSISATQGSILYRSASGWQDLAPGTANYVLSTHGPGADPTWVPQSGGGAGVFGVFPTGGSYWAVSAATGLSVVHVANSITVNDLAAMFYPVSGATYKMGIASWDVATSKITSSPVYTVTQTSASSPALPTPLYFSFSTRPTLPAGDYAVMLVRTDGTPTTSLGLVYGAANVWGPGVYMNSSSAIYSLASQAPTTSDVWSSQGGGMWNFALMYSN